METFCLSPGEKTLRRSCFGVGFALNIRPSGFWPLGERPVPANAPL
jgi:hypothetical protein